MAKINKALDYNKLLQDQAKGKLLKKHLKFPLYAGIKWDGNYVAVRKDLDGSLTYTTSGGHIYTHTDETVFESHNIPVGFVYIAERIGRTGELGDRVNCNLKGPRGQQTSTGHRYKIHDMLTLGEYDAGKSDAQYWERREKLRLALDHHIDLHVWSADTPIHTMEELEYYLKAVTDRHYEGLMLKQPTWIWKDTKSRTMDCVKYKKRPTADLYCVGTTEGEGKYEGMIGALVLEDSQGREVSVGSGLNDDDRLCDPSYFIGEVIEIQYEQILDTYIQPVVIRRRDDKSLGDID